MQDAGQYMHLRNDPLPGPQAVSTISHFDDFAGYIDTQDGRVFQIEYSATLHDPVDGVNGYISHPDRDMIRWWRSVGRRTDHQRTLPRFQSPCGDIPGLLIGETVHVIIGLWLWSQ